MADRPNLRVLPGKCPPKLRAGVLREMETRLRAVGAELSKLADSANLDLEDEDLFTEIGTAAATVQLARLVIARRQS